jgi:hypothetical protein
MMFLLYTGTGVAGPGFTLVPPPWCPPVARAIAFWGPRREAIPELESSRRADSESGLQSLPPEARNLRIVRLVLVVLGVRWQRFHLNLRK